MAKSREKNPKTKKKTIASKAVKKPAKPGKKTAVKPKPAPKVVSKVLDKIALGKNQAANFRPAVKEIVPSGDIHAVPAPPPRPKPVDAIVPKKPVFTKFKITVIALTALAVISAAGYRFSRSSPKVLGESTVNHAAIEPKTIVSQPDPGTVVVDFAACGAGSSVSWQSGAASGTISLQGINDFKCSTQLVLQQQAKGKTKTFVYQCNVPAPVGRLPFLTGGDNQNSLSLVESFCSQPVISN